MNTSVVSDVRTAKTCLAVAQQRAEHLAILGIERVIELCVGPSLRTLEACYEEVGIRAAGNDIEERWKRFYPAGQWLVGDAMQIPLDGFGAAVFAPPLSHGCTGTRKDALSINDVQPGYRRFLARKDLPEWTVLVLPGRSLSTREDRTQFYSLMAHIERKAQVHVAPMKGPKGRVTKYVDLYVRFDT